MRSARLKIMIITILISIFCCAGLYAYPQDVKSVLVKDFAVQGGYYDFFTLKVEPLSSESQQFVHGMPFDLEGDEINSSPDNNGRIIAEFQLISNTKKFMLSIDAAPLSHVDKDAHPDEELYQALITYTLDFKYTLSYYLKQENHSRGHEFRITSGVSQNNPRETNPLIDLAVDEGSYIGSADGKIYFKLTNDSYQLIHPQDGSRTLLPDGYYTGKVTVTLETVE